MAIAIIEIKARCKNPGVIRDSLLSQGALNVGTDRQIDTYFVVPTGRMKLRRGDIENTLIQYKRPNTSGPKLSDVNLYKPQDVEALYVTLCAALPVMVEVIKSREIFFIDNVKFHIDQLEKLGSFIEIEAIDETGDIGIEKLGEQCDYYLHLFEVDPRDLITHSYSDMLLKLDD